MRIYLAGLVQTGFVWRGNSMSEEVLLSEETRLDYPWDLESYHYVGENKNAPSYFREHKKTIFLDSGAFTMFTQGAKINFERYAQYIAENKDWIHIASNVDEIGAGKEAETYANQKRLEKIGAMVCPVHHARDDDKWLLQYLADGYEYIFLGGMVPETTKYLREWLDHIWANYLTRKDGTAKVKIHGFGLTTPELMWRYPWFSVDSTSWVIQGRYGMINIDLPHKNLRITISSDSPTIHKLDGHYDHLPPAEREIVDHRITELGYDAQKLRTSYGWRDHFNINFFRRMQDKPTPPFVRREKGLFDA